jgi:hypothetical protein
MLLCLLVAVQLERRARDAAAAQPVGDVEGDPAVALTDERSDR